jgi:hypothetical protein
MTSEERYQWALCRLDEIIEAGRSGVNGPEDIDALQIIRERLTGKRLISNDTRV